MSRRVLIVGQCFDYLRHSWTVAHNVEARDRVLGVELHRNGWAVDLLGLGEPGWLVDGGGSAVRKILPENVAASNYDVLLLVDVTGIRRLRAIGLWGALQQLPSLIVLDTNWKDSDLDRVNAAGLATAQTAVDYQAEHPGQTVFVFPYGGGAPAEIQPPAWPAKPAGVVRAVYCGRCAAREVQMLAKLADDPRVELWVAGLWTKLGGSFGGLTDAERVELAHPSWKFISDYTPAAYPKQSHGPVVYGQHWPFLRFADVGINLSAYSGQTAESGKISDYLSAGVPVVTDEGPPNAGDIIALKAGEIVQFGSVQALADAVVRVGSKTFDRTRLRAEAAMLLGWPVLVRRLAAHLVELVGHGRG